jgi:hypothetical protein
MKEVQRRAVSRNRLSRKVRTRLLCAGWVVVPCLGGRSRRSIRVFRRVVCRPRWRRTDDGARHPGRLRLDQHRALLATEACYVRYGRR